MDNFKSFLESNEYIQGILNSIENGNFEDFGILGDWLEDTEGDREVVDIIKEILDEVVNFITKPSKFTATSEVIFVQHLRSKEKIINFFESEQINLDFIAFFKKCIKAVVKKILYPLFDTLYEMTIGIHDNGIQSLYWINSSIAAIKYSLNNEHQTEFDAPKIMNEFSSNLRHTNPHLTDEIRKFIIDNNVTTKINRSYIVLVYVYR